LGALAEVRGKQAIVDEHAPVPKALGDWFKVTADVLDVFYHWSADESWWLLNGDISCGLWDALATVDNIVREGGQVPGHRGGGRRSIPSILVKPGRVLRRQMVFAASIHCSS
jgi:hypothetical protein